MSGLKKRHANLRAKRSGERQSFEVYSQVSQSWTTQSNSTYGILTSLPQWDMNVNLNCSNVFGLSGLAEFSTPRRLEQIYSCDVSSSDISGQEPTRSAWGKPTECLESSMIPISSCGAAQSTTLAFLPVESQPNLSSADPARPKGNRKIREKSRLKCPHPGCTSTFPRKYELERHQRTIHDLKVNIVCSVYGCNRTAKPFPRLDKFYEHVRKHHKGPERFLCVVESCRQGPLTRMKLVEHLNAQHSLGTLKQPHLKDSLNTLNLGLRYREGKNIVLDNINACPLRSQGCEYSHAPSPGAHRQMMVHLKQHELLQRSKGYEMIVAYLGTWQEYGVATCPICREPKSSLELGIWYIIRHVDKHTKEERIKHAADLAQIFRPYLTGQEPMVTWKSTDTIFKWNLDPEFRARVEESGILARDPSMPEGSELQTDNSTGAQMLDFQAK